MISLTLYTTLGCHLCAELEALLHSLANDELSLRRVEISDDDALMERYGVRIPVLVDAHGAELDRGFEQERLSQWLGERGWLDDAALATMTAAPSDTPVKGAHHRQGRRYLG